MNLTTLPESPIVLPHPLAALQELLFDANLIGETARPAGGMNDDNFEHFRFGSDFEPLKALLISEDDNSNIFRMAPDLVKFQEWLASSSDSMFSLMNGRASDRDSMATAALAARQALERLRFRLCGGALFETTANLDDALDQSDFGNVPAEYFRLPHTICYFRFGQGRRGLRMDLPEIDKSISECFLDGCYLRELQQPWGRSIILTATLRCPNAQKRYSQAFNFMPIEIRDESATVEALLEQTFWRTQARIEAQESHLLKALVFHVAKILLYLQSEHAETSDVHERSDVLARLTRAGTKKQAKMERKIGRCFDRIVVGPKQQVSPKPLLNSGGQVAPHWRRGHFRHQAHGPERSQRKLLWIKPILVHAEVIGGTTISPKAYVVKQ